MIKSSFRLAVINDEVSEDFDRACHVVAVDFGLEWIELRELWGKNILNLSAEEIAEAKRTLTKYGLRVINIASPLFKTDWPGAPLSRFSPKRDHFGAVFTFEQQNEVLERCIDLARTFSTEHLRCFDFWRLEDAGPWRKAMNQKLREAAETCAKHGVVLLLETEMACNTATGKEAAQVLAEVQNGNFLLVWDPANAAAAGETAYPDGYERLPAKRIGHCHCKGVRRKPDGQFEWARVGAGDVDWTAQIRALMQQNYHSGFSLETHWRGAGTAEASTRESFGGMIATLRSGGAVS